MPIDYLHNHKDFPALSRIVLDEMGIAVRLIEKDYWIIHVYNRSAYERFPVIFLNSVIKDNIS